MLNLVRNCFGYSKDRILNSNKFLQSFSLQIGGVHSKHQLDEFKFTTNDTNNLVISKV